MQPGRFVEVHTIPRVSDLFSSVVSLIVLCKLSTAVLSLMMERDSQQLLNEKGGII